MTNKIINATTEALAALILLMSATCIIYLLVNLRQIVIDITNALVAY